LGWTRIFKCSKNHVLGNYNYLNLQEIFSSFLRVISIYPLLTILSRVMHQIVGLGKMSVASLEIKG
jgi:hypothetical protein